MLFLFNFHFILWRVICFVSSVSRWRNPYSPDLSSTIYFVSEYWSMPGEKKVILLLVYHFNYTYYTSIFFVVGTYKRYFIYLVYLPSCLCVISYLYECVLEDHMARGRCVKFNVSIMFHTRSLVYTCTHTHKCSLYVKHTKDAWSIPDGEVSSGGWAVSVVCLRVTNLPLESKASNLLQSSH